MDCVLSYHMKALTCGVAKFNHQLARRLDVPMHQVFEPAAAAARHPLLSTKISEYSNTDIDRLAALLQTVGWRESYSIFLHAWTGTEIERQMLREAKDVFCVNAELASDLHGERPDLHEVWCPGTLLDARRFNDCELSVFTFGMAHKVRATFYDRLRQLLERTGKSYSMYLSTALHENTSFDDEFHVAFEQLQQIFGDQIHFLGYLSDPAVYNRLLDTTYFAAFFDKGVRANNTSVNIAMACGSVVITNFDDHSPPFLRPKENVVDIVTCEALPTDARTIARIGRNAAAVAEDAWGWDALVQSIQSSRGPSSGIDTAARAEHVRMNQSGSAVASSPASRLLR